MRKISAVTVGRSDFGIYLPVLRKLQEDPHISLRVIASGMHLSPEFGSTVDAISANGFEVGERVEMLLSSDTAEGVAKSIGLGVIGFGQAFARNRPDILLVLGDRFEMYAAVVAAVPFRIPIAHIHGGEVTASLDDAIRHSITKFSHLHFVSTQQYADRVIRMGEEPWRVVVSGAPSLDNLRDVSMLGFEEMKSTLGLELTQPFMMATYHPATHDPQSPATQIAEVLAAVEMRDLPVVFTMANADPGGREIDQAIRAFVGSHPKAHYVPNLGTQEYFSMMSNASLMLGNSSSGIVEACSLGLPVVNIGIRQQGRVRGANVIDVECDRNSIVAGIDQALEPTFKQRATEATNPFDRGDAGATIAQHLKNVTLGASLETKLFYDMPHI